MRYFIDLDNSDITSIRVHRRNEHEAEFSTEAIDTTPKEASTLCGRMHRLDDVNRDKGCTTLESICKQGLIVRITLQDTVCLTSGTHDNKRGSRGVNLSRLPRRKKQDNVITKSRDLPRRLHQLQKRFNLLSPE